MLRRRPVVAQACRTTAGRVAVENTCCTRQEPGELFRAARAIGQTSQAIHASQVCAFVLSKEGLFYRRTQLGSDLSPALQRGQSDNCRKQRRELSPAPRTNHAGTGAECGLRYSGNSSSRHGALHFAYFRRSRSDGGLSSTTPGVLHEPHVLADLTRAFQSTRIHKHDRSAF